MTSPGCAGASRRPSASSKMRLCSASSPGRPSVCPAMNPRGHSARGGRACPPSSGPPVTGTVGPPTAGEQHGVGPPRRHGMGHCGNGGLPEVAQVLAEAEREMRLGETGDAALANEGAQPVDGEHAVEIVVDAAVVVVRVVERERARLQRARDPTIRAVALDLERLLIALANARGADQADGRLFEPLAERRVRHAVPRELQGRRLLLRAHLSLSSASMILSVGGCAPMSWMSM